MNFLEEREFVGNLDQLFKVLPYKMMTGRADGLKMLQIQNGSGMIFDLAVDRGLDLPYLSFCGNNIGYISPGGMVSPQYFDDDGIGFLKSFTAGFLTTCGLQNIGNPGSYQGKTYGLHGKIANTPANQYSYKIELDETGKPFVEVQARMEEGEIFADRLSLTRNIRCPYKDKKILIRDKVKNEGFQRAQHMILYHINIGYPMLGPDSELMIPSKAVVPRNEHSEKGLKNWGQITKPQVDFEEMCYFHEMKTDDDGRTMAGIYNYNSDQGIVIRFNTRQLDHFIQWKMMGKGDYVMGLEPSNSTIDGVEDAYNNGQMKFLDPGEEVLYDLEIEIMEGEEDLRIFKKNLANLI